MRTFYVGGLIILPWFEVGFIYLPKTWLWPTQNYLRKSTPRYVPAPLNSSGHGLIERKSWVPTWWKHFFVLCRAADFRSEWTYSFYRNASNKAISTDAGSCFRNIIRELHLGTIHKQRCLKINNFCHQPSICCLLML